MSTSTAEAATRPKIEYAIFDMDGLLSDDSERVYTIVTNKILARYGCEMTWEIKSGVMGKANRPAVQRQAAEYIYSYFPGLEEKLSVDDFLKERIEEQEKMWKHVPPMRGAVDLVRHLYDSGVPIALATGSSQSGLVQKTSHLPELFSLFPPTNILTADSPEVQEGRGKPKPDIFLAAARSLGFDVGTAFEASKEQLEARSKGLVFEDAVPGVNAGVAAGMNVIWVPDAALRALQPDETYGAAEILESLDEWDPVKWGLPKSASLA